MKEFSGHHFKFCLRELLDNTPHSPAQASLVTFVACCGAADERRARKNIATAEQRQRVLRQREKGLDQADCEKPVVAAKLWRRQRAPAKGGGSQETEALRLSC